MKLKLSVLAQDQKRENFWMSELRTALQDVQDIELSSISSGVEPGQVVFVDGSTESALISLEQKLSKIDRKGRAVFLVVSDRSGVPQALLDGWVDDLILHPFRTIDVLSKLFLFQRILHWNEVAQISEGFGDVLDRLKEDLELASRLQKARAPVRFPEIRGLKVQSRYLAGLRSGGDYFDLAESRDGGQLSLILSDSSSHGLSSAVLSALMKVALKLSADEARSTRETVRKIHSEILSALSERDHLSLFYGVLSKKDFRLRYLNLGFSRIFHAPEGKPFKELAAQGEAIRRSRMLGEPQEGAVLLEPKDRIVVLSDGFIEGAGGAEGTRKLLDETRGKEAQDVIQELLFRVKAPLKGPDELPPQDCSVIVLDLDGNVLRLAR